MKLNDIVLNEQATVPAGNWFNANTGRDMTIHDEEDYIENHSETVLYNWKTFGFNSKEEAINSVEDGAYGVLYARGWVRWFGERNESLLLTSTMSNFNTNVAKIKMRKLAALFKPHEFAISDQYNVDCSKGHVSYQDARRFTFWHVLDSKQLIEQGQFIDVETGTEILK